MKRILIIRPSAIGDIVMASPVIDALRRSIPEAYIGWLVDAPAAGLLAHHPDLDCVMPWNRSHWIGLTRQGRWIRLALELKAFRGSLVACRFDTAIDLQGLFRSRLLAILSGAPRRIGFVSKEPGGWLMTRLETKGTDHCQMGSEYRHLMDRLGLDVGDFAPKIAVSPEQRRRAEGILAKRGIGGDYALICPFTTRPQKHWVADRWAGLVEAINRAFALPVVALGGPEHRKTADRMLAGSPVANLTGESSLGEAAAMIERAALLVGVDTGLTHMGTAFRRPTVALFGPTCPYRKAPSPLTRVIYHPRDCSPCRRSPSCGDFECMSGIETAEVVEMIRQVMPHRE
jgi:heptosyltransferase-1